MLRSRRTIWCYRYGDRACCALRPRRTPRYARPERNSALRPMWLVRPKSLVSFKSRKTRDTDSSPKASTLTVNLRISATVAESRFHNTGHPSDLRRLFIVARTARFVLANCVDGSVYGDVGGSGTLCQVPQWWNCLVSGLYHNTSDQACCLSKPSM
jgi:hypothetical protein